MMQAEDKSNYEYLGLRLKQRQDIDNDIKQYIAQAVVFVHKFIQLDPYTESYKTLLDVGCMDGFAMQLFRGLGYNVLGADRFPMWDEARNKQLAEDMSRVDFYELSQYYKNIDVIFCNHTLEHADSVYRLMWELSKCLRVGGILFVAVPDGTTEWAWSILDNSTHFSILTAPFLDTCMKRYGFQTAITTRQFREDKKEIWAIGVKMREN